MRRHALATLALLAPVLLAACGGGETPTGPREHGPGLIAFSTDRDGNAEIYTMRTDGSSPTRLTDHPARDFAPAWSRDGGKIAFTSQRDGNWEIYTMNPDGSGLRRLTSHSSADFGPAWSPDGSKIAFTSQRDGNFEIYTMNADGSGLTRVTDDPSVDASPSWSPDGSKIAFATHRANQNLDIYTMNPDGTDLLQITTDQADDVEPEWSPGGSRIAFISHRNSPDDVFQTNTEVYTMGAGGGGLTRRTNSEAIESGPVWAPDGSGLAYESGRDGNKEVYVLELSSSQHFNLTSDGSADTNPSWGPAP